MIERDTFREAIKTPQDVADMLYELACACNGISMKRELSSELELTYDQMCSTLQHASNGCEKIIHRNLGDRKQ
jgi:hypothetical protein